MHVWTVLTRTLDVMEAVNLRICAPEQRDAAQIVFEHFLWPVDVSSCSQGDAQASLPSSYECDDVAYLAYHRARSHAVTHGRVPVLLRRLIGKLVEHELLRPLQSSPDTLRAVWNRIRSHEIALFEQSAVDIVRSRAAAVYDAVGRQSSQMEAIARANDDLAKSAIANMMSSALQAARHGTRRPSPYLRMLWIDRWRSWHTEQNVTRTSSECGEMSDHRQGQEECMANRNIDSDQDARAVKHNEPVPATSKTAESDAARRQQEEARELAELRAKIFKGTRSAKERVARAKAARRSYAALGLKARADPRVYGYLRELWAHLERFARDVERSEQAKADKAMARQTARGQKEAAERAKRKMERAAEKAAKADRAAQRQAEANLLAKKEAELTRIAEAERAKAEQEARETAERRRLEEAKAIAIETAEARANRMMLCEKFTSLVNDLCTELGVASLESRRAERLWHLIPDTHDEMLEFLRMRAKQGRVVEVLSEAAIHLEGLAEKATWPNDFEWRCLSIIRACEGAIELASGQVRVLDITAQLIEQFPYTFDDLLFYARMSLKEGNLHCKRCLDLLVKQEPLHPMVATLRRRLSGEQLACVARNDIEVMGGIEFETYVSGLLRERGYAVQTTRTVGDYGADILVHGRRGGIIVLQLKRWSQPANLRAVQEVVAAMGQYKAHGSVVVCPSGFLASCRTLAESNSVELWGMTEIRRLEAKDVTFSAFLCSM